MRCGAALAGGDCIANPATGRCFYCDRELRPDPRIAAARRIKRALLAEADRIAGVDTSKPPRPLARLDEVRAELDGSLSMTQAERLLREDLPPLLDLLARVRAVIDASVARETAMAAIDGWAEVRDLLYPDTDVARQLNVRRRMTPAEREAEREAASAAEAEAWAGVSTDPSPAAHSDAPPPVGFSECAGCLQLYPAGDSLKLRTKGKLFTFEPGVFCPDCAARYDRGELRPCAECGRLTQHELCSQCADPDEAGHV